MDLHKKLMKCVSLLCIISLLISLINIPAFAVTANTISATTTTTIKQGNSAYCDVYIDSAKDLAALDVTVHFDETKVKVNSVNNCVGCALFDYSIGTNTVQFSYILDGNGSDSKTQLFSFDYQVLPGADIGNTYFDIVVGEAYDKSLNEVSTSGSRCSFTITKSNYSNSTELLDQEFGAISCSGCSTNVDVWLDETYTEDELTMRLDGVFNNGTKQIDSMIESTVLNLVDTSVPIESLIAVSIATEPEKLWYITGEDIVLDGISFVGSYSDGTQVAINKDEIDNVLVDTTSPGKKVVTVSICGFDVTYCVYVHDRMEVLIDADTYPESKHNYVNNMYETKSFSYQGATSIVVTFDSRTAVEKGCDYIYIYDGAYNQIARYTGADAANQSLTIPGDTFKIRLTSDGYNTQYGYAFSSIVAVVNEIVHQPVVDPATANCTQGGLTEGSHCEICGYISTEQEEVAALGHDYQATFTWSEDHNSCVATITCERDCGFSQVVNCAVYHGGSNQEQTTHTAVVEYEDTNFTDVFPCANFQISFNNWDGTQISSAYYHWGDSIIVPADPTKAADSTYTYTFAGWDNTVVNCTGNATYIATYSSTYNDYTIIFKNDDGSVIREKTYHWGDAIEVPTNPTKAADSTHTYTFAGWDNDVVNCAGNATYTATYSSTYNDYTIIFKNDDGSVIRENVYHWGDSIEVPANPTKEVNDNYANIYSFAGWDKDVVNCAGNTTYTATYTAAPLEQLVLVSQPDKVRYLVGDAIDLTGLVLQGIYASGAVLSLENVSVQFVSADLSSAGRKMVTITIGGVAATFEVLVHDGGERQITANASTYPESTHNYADNMRETKTFTYPDATSIFITFNSQTAVEKDCDYIYIYDGADNQIARYTGTDAANQSLTIPGDTFKVKLISDGYNTQYGYAFSSIVAVVNETVHQTVVDSATVTCTQGGLTEGSHCDICGDVLVAQEEIAALGHKYNGAFVWSDDHTACTAMLSCARGCGDTDTVSCTITLNELHQAQTIHTAVATYNDQTFTDVLTCENYQVLFVNCDGTQISSTYYHLGDVVIAPEIVEAPESLGKGYVFKGWDQEVVSCAGSVIYTAVFTQNVAIGDLNDDGIVTDQDAIFLLYHTFLPEQYPVNQDCDFNGDGKVSDQDAAYLMYHTFLPEQYSIT